MVPVSQATNISDYTEPSSSEDEIEYQDDSDSVNLDPDSSIVADVEARVQNFDILINTYF